jgi:hypothetical protein
VGIAATMRKGLVELPCPQFVASCKEAGTEVLELSGWPQSYSGTLALDEAGVEQVRALTGRAKDGKGSGGSSRACPSARATWTWRPSWAPSAPHGDPPAK